MIGERRKGGTEGRSVLERNPVEILQDARWPGRVNGRWGYDMRVTGERMDQ